MLDILQRLEGRLVRLEAGVLVALVLLMLLLAVYNVFYRNVLVPAQVAITTVVVPAGQSPPDEAAEVAPEEPVAAEPAAEDFGGGFGGGFGEEEEAEAEAEGFGGGFGGGFGEDEAEEPAAEPVEEPADEGFGGGFGGGFGEETEAEAEEGFGGGFGGGFGEEVEAGATPDDGPETAQTAETVEAGETVVIRPPEEGSFAALVVDLIDAVKLEWIDVLLRQLVLIVGFLGAMLATQRRKHITIDALSKILPERVLGWVDVATNALAIGICALLAMAGWDLVQIGRAFPKELMRWADEWVFQLAFPIGFGLLTLHFVVRLFEALEAGRRGVPPEQLRAATGEGEEGPPPVAGVAGAEGGAP